MLFTQERQVKVMNTYRTDDLDVYSLSQCLHLYVFLSEDGDRPLRLTVTGLVCGGGGGFLSSLVV